MKFNTLKNSVLLLCIWLFTANSLYAGDSNSEKIPYPATIYTGLQGKHHVQGIAIDKEKGHIYFSFTTRLIKTDLRGNLIGSVEGLTGHLGCLTRNPVDGRIYGSLEYKNDAIGKGIAGEKAAKQGNAFYVVIFDPDKITRPNMSAEKDDVMTSVYLKKVVDDFETTVMHQGKEVKHRYGCSGIDGITFAPEVGKKGGKMYLYVAYGIYGDQNRTDNDYQVIHAYDVSNWKKYEQPLSQNNMHNQGPAKNKDLYFAYTGNTDWGIQNMAYDPTTGNVLAAVYRGRKKDFPNYSFFMFDWSKPAKKVQLKGHEGKEIQKTIALAPLGLYDEKSGVYGWNFKFGTTGLCPLGNGYFYISHPSSKPEQSCTAKLYKWTGAADGPFQLVTE
ncbi:MAG: hypothetical protein Q4A54_09570 [Parabacteroides sp.]|nr:hypothetical protein [Parabacteroides sp.]